MASTPSTLVVGEALVDVVHAADGSVTEHVGGSPLNVAVGLARLGHEVTLATRFGRDAHGELVAARLREDGITLAPGSDGAQRTSTATAVVGEDGSADYSFDIVWDLPSPAVAHGHLHAGSIGAHLSPGGREVLAAMKVARHRATVSYDPNVRPSLLGDRDAVREEVDQRVRVSDVVKASDEDILWLLGSDRERADLDDLLGMLRSWVGLGAGLAVVTLGPKGAAAVLADGEVVEVPGQQVEVVDTVGAGDSFASGLLSALLDADLLGTRESGERLREAGADAVRAALERGVATSAITVSRAGAQPPSRDELAR